MDDLATKFRTIDLLSNQQASRVFRLTSSYRSVQHGSVLSVFTYVRLRCNQSADGTEYLRLYYWCINRIILS